MVERGVWVWWVCVCGGGGQVCGVGGGWVEFGGSSSSSAAKRAAAAAARCDSPPLLLGPAPGSMRGAGEVWACIWSPKVMLRAVVGPWQGWPSRQAVQQVSRASAPLVENGGTPCPAAPPPGGLT